MATKNLAHEADKALMERRVAEDVEKHRLRMAILSATESRLGELLDGLLGDNWRAEYPAQISRQSVHINDVSFTLAGDLASVEGVGEAELLATAPRFLPSGGEIRRKVASLADLGQLYEDLRKT